MTLETKTLTPDIIVDRLTHSLNKKCNIDISYTDSLLISTVCITGILKNVIVYEYLNQNLAELQLVDFSKKRYTIAKININLKDIVEIEFKPNKHNYVETHIKCNIRRLVI